MDRVEEIRRSVVDKSKEFFRIECDLCGKQSVKSVSLLKPHGDDDLNHSLILCWECRSEIEGGINARFNNGHSRGSADSGRSGGPDNSVGRKEGGS